MMGSFGQVHSIKAGFWLLFGVASTILITFIGVLYWDINTAERIAQQVQQSEAISNTMNKLVESMLNAETGQRGYLLTQDVSYLAPYTDGVEQSNKRFQALQGMVKDPEILDLLKKLENIANFKKAELAKTIALSNEGRHDDALAVVKKGSGKKSMDEFRQLIETAISIQNRKLKENRIDFANKLNGLIIALLIGGLVTLIFLYFTAFRMTSRLGKPIDELMKGIQTMMTGDFSHKVIYFVDDEIGSITNSFNVMQGKLKETMQTRDAIQNELERSNNDLDSFAYVASHDLKAPLRGIRNLAEWISEDVEKISSDDTRENLCLLRNRVDRLDGLLDSLLAYSRVGRKLGQAEIIESGKLVKEISDYLAKPGFSITCAEDMPVITSPKAPLELVLRNLINNALKHHDRIEGKVSISAKELGGKIEFRVQDDGAGIAPDFHEKIFHMFQTLKPRDQTEGSGMGLAIVRKSIEGFGGSIHVESNPPERGTAFIFTWPRNAEAPTSK